MYAGGGEAADQTVRLMLAGCETVVKLGGSGVKNALAISLALAKNNKQISGKVNLGKMLQETRDLRVFSMSKEQYRQFAKMAKPQKLLYSVIRDTDKDSNMVDVVLPVTELERANLIFEKMLYNLPEQKPQEQTGAVEQSDKEQPDKTPVLENEQIEKTEEVEIVPTPEKQQEDNEPKKESRLASDLSGFKSSSSIWKESGNITRTTFENDAYEDIERLGERPVVKEEPTPEERLKALLSELDFSNTAELGERPSIEGRLKAFQAQIDAVNNLTPTRNKTKNKEQAR